MNFIVSKWELNEILRSKVQNFVFLLEATEKENELHRLYQNSDQVSYTRDPDQTLSLTVSR